MKKLLTILVCVGMLSLPSVASADLYSYDFSTFSSDGDGFEGAVLDYVTLSSENVDLSYLGWSWGSDIDGGISSGIGASGDVYMDFSVAIDEITITAGDNGCGGCDLDAFSLYLYEFGTNAFIGRYDTPLYGGNALGTADTHTLTVNASNIGRVVFDPGNSGVLPGINGNAGGVYVTDLEYNTAAVPEPATILLLGSGLIGLAFFRRKTVTA